MRLEAAECGERASEHVHKQLPVWCVLVGCLTEHVGACGMLGRGYCVGICGAPWVAAACSQELLTWGADIGALCEAGSLRKCIPAWWIACAVVRVCVGPAWVCGLDVPAGGGFMSWGRDLVAFSVRA